MSSAELIHFLEPVAGDLTQVEAELTGLLRSEVPIVQELAAHVARGQGKRLRPALLLLATRFLGGAPGPGIHFAAVYELIHTATLVHDDVIDHADLRRAAPTLNQVWGNPLTVLFGDLLYIKALGWAVAGRDFRVLEILADVTTRMIEGELIQDHRLYDLGTTEADYWEILERKTALLFGACAETAAVLAGRGADDAEAMRAYGLGLGRAFQLVDDLLDYAATSDQLGKPTGSDLREGKLTLPILRLLAREPAEARALVQEIWGAARASAASPEAFLRLQALLDRHQVLEEVRAQALRASWDALAGLAQVQGDADAGGRLRTLPDLLLARTR